MAPLLAEGNSLELRLLGLCIYIDVLEYGGDIGRGVAPAIFPMAVEVNNTHCVTAICPLYSISRLSV